MQTRFNPPYILGTTTMQRRRFGHMEWLESRNLLAGGSPSVDFSNLRVDHSTFSEEHVLVRLADEACRGYGCQLRVDQILPRASSVPLTPMHDKLFKVALPAGLDTLRALQRLQNHADVLFAQPDYRVYLDAVPNDARYGEMWGLENQGQTGGRPDADIDAEAAWDVTQGDDSTVVAVIDTGVQYTHPDLADNIWTNTDEIPGDGVDNDANGYVDDFYGYDFINRDPNPMDDQGHGTHVAGTIGAVGNNSIGVAGVNWDVQLMSLKFLGADGSGSTSDAIEAIYYAAANGAHIINASWGGDPFSQALVDAITSARDDDVLFVAAAGNGNIFGIGQNNDQTPFYPASYDISNVLAVAAVDHNDDLATFSNFGATSVDLAAPGVNILSTVLGSGYGTSSGTSMAAPHVAGVAALVRSIHPTWTHTQIFDQLLDTVDSLPQLQGVTVSGGRLNAAAAVGNPVPPPPPPPPVPLPVYDNFSDGFAEDFSVQSGRWSVSSRYDVTPAADDDDLANISTLRLELPLPANIDLRATVNADQGRLELFGIPIRDILTNAFLVFDYQSVDDFKFAGADIDADQWVIGHRDSAGWSVDAFVSAPLNHGTDYRLKLLLTEDDSATLLVDGVATLTHTLSDSWRDGELGLGTRNGASHFDEVIAQEHVQPVPGDLPYFEDFQDGVADHVEQRSGLMGISNGQYRVQPTGGDAISTLLLNSALPANLQLDVTFNADDRSGSQLSNAFMIFDYEGPADFKFAGAYLGSDEWVVGHRDSTGWRTDASVPAVIDALTDYDLKVTIEGSRVSLSADGMHKLSYEFADNTFDGDVGIGTRQGVTRFDDWSVQVFVPPPSATLPYHEDFDDGTADFLEPRTGAWQVSGGTYAVTPAVDGDGVSTLRLSGMPQSMSIQAQFNADPATNGRLSNAFLIFDYEGPTSFKFAGAYVGTDRWLIGHRDASGWITDAYTSGVIDPNVDYQLELRIEADGLTTLLVEGLAQVSHDFSGSLTDGDLGIGSRDALSRFDNLNVDVLAISGPQPTSLPYLEDFQDGQAENVRIQTSVASVATGTYHVAPTAGGDAISTLVLNHALPDEVEMQVIFNADSASSGVLSNGFLIFDYRGEHDFKFAGAYVGTDRWLIGHRDSTGWIIDQFVTDVIDPMVDYELRVVIESNSEVTLFANDVAQVSHQYAGSVTIGDVGIGTKNAHTRFDNWSVNAYDPPPTAPVPHQDDFQDGVADFFDPQDGVWSVVSGRYGVVPSVDQDGISLLKIDPFNGDPDISVTFNADSADVDRLSNAFIIFDYVGPFNFKFAGAYVGTDKWLIGHRDASGWITDASISGAVDALADYRIRLTIEQNQIATLYANGIPQVSHQFNNSLVDGEIGVGTRNAISRFDNLSVSVMTGPLATGLPVAENFDDGIADNLQRESGLAGVASGLYHVRPVDGSDAISTVVLGQTLPSSFEMSATINADDRADGLLSNAFLIFDYQGPFDFKFAGAYVATNQWLIGHRNSTGWVTDAASTAPINPLANYDVRLEIESGSTARLSVDGQQQVIFTFAASIVDGEIGLGTRNAVSRFDDFAVQAGAAGMSIQVIQPTLPKETTLETTPQPIARSDALKRVRLVDRALRDRDDWVERVKMHREWRLRRDGPTDLQSERVDRLLATMEL